MRIFLNKGDIKYIKQSLHSLDYYDQVKLDENDEDGIVMKAFEQASSSSSIEQALRALNKQRVVHPIYHLQKNDVVVINESLKHYSKDISVLFEYTDDDRFRARYQHIDEISTKINHQVQEFYQFDLEEAERDDGQ